MVVDEKNKPKDAEAEAKAKAEKDAPYQFETLEMQLQNSWSKLLQKEILPIDWMQKCPESVGKEFCGLRL